MNDIKQILQDFKNNNITLDEAYLKLKEKPFEDIGYAKVDLHRKLRQGVSEVIYGAGKTPEQIAGIISVMRSHHEKAILITRLSPESHSELLKLGCEVKYYPEARAGVAGEIPEPEGKAVIHVGVDAPGAKDRRMHHALFLLPYSMAGQIEALHNGAQVLRCDYTDQGIEIEVRCDDVFYGRLSRYEVR